MGRNRQDVANPFKDQRFAGTTLPESSNIPAFVAIFLIVTCAVPSNLTIPALGSVGRLTTLWALLALVWWILHQVSRTMPERAVRRPIRIFLGVLLVFAVASYAIAMLHGVPEKESSPADGGLIRLFAWTGICFLLNDGLRNRIELLKVLRHIVMAGTLTACLGLLQFVTGSSLVDWMSIPGLNSADSISNIDVRGDFVRAAGMASHPLEYGVVLAVSFPLAITLAFTDTTKSWLAKWTPVCAIVCASALSVSRTALIATAVSFVALIPAWPKQRRRRAYVAIVLLLVGVYFITPGMLGTLRGLFTFGSADSSINSRTESFSIAIEMVANNPIVGRGFGTFLPEYVIVDNQYLGLLVELGVLGVISFVSLIAAGLHCAKRARLVSVDEVMIQLSQAVLASLAAVGIAFAFFDGLSFPMAAAMLFLILGVSGALWRIVQEERAALPAGKLDALTARMTPGFRLLRPRREGVDDGPNA